MGIISFFLYNLSNVLLIVLLPTDVSKEFLNFYSFSSGIFSFLIFYNFTNSNFLNRYTVIVIGIFILVILIKYPSLELLIILYVFILLFSDYFFSQSNLKKLNLIFKFILLILSTLLFFNFSLIFVLKAKCILILLCLLLSNFFKVSIKTLKVNSPLNYSIYTCLIYFGSLFLISLLSDNEIIKIFYISLQILLGLKLKIFDLKIRDIELKIFDFEKLFNVFSIFFFLILSIYFREVIYFFIYLISYYFLEHVKKKYILKP